MEKKRYIKSIMQIQGGRNKESKAGWEKIDEEICVQWPFIDDKFGGFEVWKLVSFLKTA